MPPWKVVYAPQSNESLSLYKFLQETQAAKWEEEFELPLSDKEKPLLSLPIGYDKDNFFGTLNVYASSSVSWEDQVQAFCDKYSVYFGECSDLMHKIGEMLMGATSSEEEL